MTKIQDTNKFQFSKYLPSGKAGNDQIEKTLYVHSISSLPRQIDKSFSRLYFGHEFCPFLLPSESELEKVLEFVQREKLDFTFITPWLTDESLNLVKRLIKLIPSGSEVVINDYGLLFDKEINFISVLGRLLNGQIRGLRKDYKKRFSKKVLEHFQSCQPQVRWFAEFLKTRGINRVELDNLPQGLMTDFKKFGFSGSIYYPYGYITVTRFCPYIVKNNRLGNIFLIKKCNQKCTGRLYSLQNEEIDGEIFVQGNYHFYKNTKLPDNLSELGIDRVVYEIL